MKKVGLADVLDGLKPSETVYPRVSTVSMT